MTVSFHKYGEYFPGTGELRDIGVGNGKYNSVNFPLRDGITDKTYKSAFEPVIGAVMEYYKPDAIVLQCGGDSLSGDRLGCFNLSMKGHANCVKFVKSFNKPTLVLGGGGYTMRNVARTWAYETGALIGMELGPQLPYNDYYEYFAPDYELNVLPSNMDNANSMEYLKRITEEVISNLRHTGTPSVQMTEVPRNPIMNGMDSDAEDEADDLDADTNMDVRNTQRRADQRVSRDEEFDESEDEEMDEANGIRRQPGATRQRNISIMDHKNPHADDDIDLDSEGEAVLVSRTNGDALEGTGSREENRRIAEEKADAALSLKSASSRGSSTPGSPTTAHATNGQLSSTAADEMADEAADEADEDDIEMDMDIDEGTASDKDDSDDDAYPSQPAVISTENPVATSPSLKDEKTPAESPAPVAQAATDPDVDMEDDIVADPAAASTEAKVESRKGSAAPEAVDEKETKEVDKE